MHCLKTDVCDGVHRPKPDTPAREVKDISKIIRDIQMNASKILEYWSRAYLAETGLMPSQVTLVQSHDAKGIYWRFGLNPEVTPSKDRTELSNLTETEPELKSDAKFNSDDQLKTSTQSGLEEEIDSGPFSMSRYLNREDLYAAMSKYIDSLKKERDSLKTISDRARFIRDREIDIHAKVEMGLSKERDDLKSQLTKAVDGFNFANDMRIKAEKETAVLTIERDRFKLALTSARAAMTYAYEDHVDQYYLNVRDQIDEALEAGG